MRTRPNTLITQKATVMVKTLDKYTRDCVVQSTYAPSLCPDAYINSTTSLWNWKSIPAQE